MGSRDRPRHNVKRKPKDKAPKAPPPAAAYEPPMTVELVKKKRKPREPRQDEE